MKKRKDESKIRNKKWKIENKERKKVRNNVKLEKKDREIDNGVNNKED